MKATRRIIKRFCVVTNSNTPEWLGTFTSIKEAKAFIERKGILSQWVDIVDEDECKARLRKFDEERFEDVLKEERSRI